MSALDQAQGISSNIRRRIAKGASLLTVSLALANLANARDLGQWGEEGAAMHKWFESLRMPDHPMASCCGAGDAYWADDFEVKDGKYVAIVTDTRPDGPLQRAHIQPGTRFAISNRKISPFYLRSI